MIFQGEAVSAIVDERSPEYEKTRATLVWLKRSNEPEDIIRS